MAGDADVNDTERDLRRASALKSNAEAGGETLTEDHVAELYQLAKGHDLWMVTYSALTALNAVAKNRPALLAGILPQLIQQHLVLPSEHADEAFAFEDVSTTPEIGRPVYASWILDNIADHDPEVLRPHTDTLTNVCRDETTQPSSVLLARGRLAVADPDGLPVDSIRTDLEALSDRSDSYGTQAQKLLHQIERS